MTDAEIMKVFLQKIIDEMIQSPDELAHGSESSWIRSMRTMIDTTASIRIS